MADVKFDDYKAQALAELVKIDVSLNTAAIGLSDKEAREKGLWLNKDKLPTEKQIRDKFNEIKPKLDRELSRAEKYEQQAKENQDVAGEFDTLFDSLYDQDEELGLNDKQTVSLGILLSLNKKKKALNVLKKSSLLKGE